VQTSLAAVLSDNVASLEAAQDLEVHLRQLRLHALLYVLGPTPERRQEMDADHRGFEDALAIAKATANLPGEPALLQSIEAGYDRYREQLAKIGVEAAGLRSREDFLRWADAHSVRELVQPCHELLRVNKQAMERVAHDSASLSRRTRYGMLGLGLVGPALGLIGGFGIARGLSGSLAQLHVRVEDVSAHLEREVGPFPLVAKGDLAALDKVVQREPRENGGKS
jgi:hypothetical protein